jgi:hypothetical protein
MVFVAPAAEASDEEIPSRNRSSAALLVNAQMRARKVDDEFLKCAK